MAGGAYAGKYVPYMSAAMVDQKDTTHFDIAGNYLFTPMISNSYAQERVTTLPFVEEYQIDLQLNDTTMADLRAQDTACGFDTYRQKWLTFPSAGTQPDENIVFDQTSKCDVLNSMAAPAYEINPCLDIDSIVRQCPTPESWQDMPAESSDVHKQLYFNRPDVKEALHAPASVTWAPCNNNVTDFEDYTATASSSQEALPKVIDATNRTLLTVGGQNLLMTVNGTLMTIQNMTWGGRQGFHEAPSTPLITEQGTMGVTHFERGLMWAEPYLAGPIIQDQPAVAYKLLQWVLGNIDSL